MKGVNIKATIPYGLSLFIKDTAKEQRISESKVIFNLLTTAYYHEKSKGHITLTQKYDM